MRNIQLQNMSYVKSKTKHLQEATVRVVASDIATRSGTLMIITFIGICCFFVLMFDYWSILYIDLVFYEHICRATTMLNNQEQVQQHGGPRVDSSLAPCYCILFRWIYNIPGLASRARCKIKYRVK